MAKYYITKHTRGMKRADGTTSTAIYIPAEWGLDTSHQYFFTIKRYDDSDDRAIRFPRKITSVGNGHRIVLDKRWGFDPGEMITLIIEDIGKDDS
jgi:hypothetical protein